MNESTKTSIGHIQTREEEADEYIIKHKLMNLFISLTEMLVHHKPGISL